MPLFVTVTPGTTVSSTTTLSASTLNLLGTPSIDITGSVDGGTLSVADGSLGLSKFSAITGSRLIGNGSPVSAYPTELASTDLAFAPGTINIGTGAVTTAKLADSSSTTTGVTYAKIQHVTDARLIGRSSGTNGVAQEITVGSGLSLASGALTNGILRYTTTLKDIPTLGSGARNIQWLESLGELPSLTYIPQIVKVVLRCKTQQLPFEVGYEIPIESVLIQGFFDNRMVFCYQPCVNMGLVGGTDAFVNVWFATLNPGSPTFPWNSGSSAVSSQLVILDNTGVDMVINTNNWQVKAYLLHSPTWA
jgi:hypothetical protein